MLHCSVVFHSATTLQFTEADYSNSESALAIKPAVQLLTGIATNLTVQIVPISISEASNRNLLPTLPTLPAFNPRAPNIATSKLTNRLL